MTNVWDIRSIRAAIWNQAVSFPAQVPVFMNLHRADIQWRIAVLYFVQGWSSIRIAKRYGVTTKRVAQILRQWTSHAIARGYVGFIPSLSEGAAELQSA
jgi:hypothetical protein